MVLEVSLFFWILYLSLLLACQCAFNASLSFPVLHQRQVNGRQQLPVRSCDFREGCVTATISPDVVWAGSSYALALQVTNLSRTLQIAKLQTQQKTVCKSAQIQTFPPPWRRTGGDAVAMTDFWMSAHASEAGKADKEANKRQISRFAGWEGRCCHVSGHFVVAAAASVCTWFGICGNTPNGSRWDQIHIFVRTPQWWRIWSEVQLLFCPHHMLGGGIYQFTCVLCEVLQVLVEAMQLNIVLSY